MRQELADRLLSQAGNLADPPVSWRGTDTYIQSEGINQDLGVYQNPDDFYRVHGTNVSGWKKWFFINVIRHQINRNVVRMRSKLRPPASVLSPASKGAVFKVSVKPARMLFMRRWLPILLLALLPLQLSWAAVSVYCQHETGAAAQHFGHHEHQHHADEKSKDDSGPKTLGAVDADCPVCHAGCATALHASQVMPVLYSAADMHVGEQALLSSPPPTLPDRPNWAHLA